MKETLSVTRCRKILEKHFSLITRKKTANQRKGTLTMAKLRFGLVGCGQIAKCNHAPEMAKLPRSKAEITALYDIKRGKAEQFAKEKNLNAKICRSYEELLASDIDCVIIATPNCFHFPQTMDALKAGKHVLVEKPMASRVEDADKMIRLSLEKNLVLQVNQSLRFSPLYAEMSRRIAEGAIGKPMHIRCIRAATSSPEVGWSPGAVWFVKKKYEGSLVTDIAVHMADFLQWSFGPVKKIQAVTRCLSHEVPDNVSAVFDFANGATGVLELSWTFPMGESAIAAYGDKGTLKTTPDGFEIIPADKKKKTVSVKADKIKSLPDSHAVFVKRIAEGCTDAWDVGRSALALCVAINESSRTGKAVAPKNRKK